MVVNTLARDVQTRCEAGDLPAWMETLRDEQGLGAQALGAAVASIAQYADITDWESVVELDEHEDFETYVEEGVPTLTLPDQEIFLTGTWNGDEYSEADLKQMVEAFPEVGFQPPLKLGHSEEQKIIQEDGLPSVGWVSKLATAGGKLVATLSGVPKKVAKLIDLGGYRQRSAEIYWNYKDGRTGRVFPRVLKALTLCGADVPAVKGMPSLSTLDSYLELYCHGESQEETVHYAGIDFTEITTVGAETEKVEKEVAPDTGAIKKMAEEMAAMKVRQEELAAENKALTERVAVSEAQGQAEAVAFFIATAKKDGKLAPSEEARVTQFAQTLDQSSVHKFTDGETSVEKTQWELFKDMIGARESGFVPRSEDRGSSDDQDQPGKGSVKSYAGREFNETTYSKAYTEALASGMPQADAYNRAKRIGWGEKLPALKADQGGDS